MAAADISLEYQHWDLTESVTVTLRRHPVDQSISVATAYRDNFGESVQQFQGVAIRSGDVKWCIPVALLGAAKELRPEDEIKDSSEVVWVVRSVSKIQIGTSASHWEALCGRQRT